MDQLFSLSICSWFLKSLVYEIDFWTWFFVYFKLDFYCYNLIIFFQCRQINTKMTVGYTFHNDHTNIEYMRNTTIAVGCSCVMNYSSRVEQFKMSYIEKKSNVPSNYHNYWYNKIPITVQCVLEKVHVFNFEKFQTFQSLMTFCLGIL